MFISFGDRRINLSLVKQYNPIKKTSNEKTYYIIEFTFLDDKKEELYFYDREKERNEYLKNLDENNIIKCTNTKQK